MRDYERSLTILVDPTKKKGKEGGNLEGSEAEKGSNKGEEGNGVEGGGQEKVKVDKARE